MMCVGARGVQLRDAGSTDRKGECSRTYCVRACVRVFAHVISGYKLLTLHEDSQKLVDPKVSPP